MINTFELNFILIRMHFFFVDKENISNLKNDFLHVFNLRTSAILICFHLIFLRNLQYSFADTFFFSGIKLHHERYSDDYT